MNLEFEIQVVLGAGQNLFGGFFPLKGQIKLPMKFGRIGGVTQPLPPLYGESLRRSTFG